jgi:hypothetical protein
MDKKGFSFTKRDSLSYLGAFFIIITLVGALVFVLWSLVDMVKRLLEGL